MIYILRLLCVLLISSSVTLFAQETRTITLDKFSELSVEGNFHVELIYSNKHQVVLSGSQRILRYVEVKQKGNRAVVHYTKHNMGEHIAVKVYSKHFKELHLSGSTKTSSKSIIKEDVLDLTLNGSGSTELKLQVQDITGKINGSGTLTFNGKVSDNAKFTINGSGDFEAEELSVSNCIAKINGSGDIKVGNILNKLKANINGSGDILYQGKADIINISINGSGNVKSY